MIIVLALAPALRADMQGSLNVVVNALASAKGLAVEHLGVGDIVDRGTGQPSDYGHSVEGALRDALGSAGHWTLLKEGEDASGADALLSGSYLRQGGSIHLRVELRSVPDGALLWSRNALLDADGISPSALQPEPEAATDEPMGGGDEGLSPGPYADQVIPSLPLRRAHPFHFGMSVAYKAFFPTNSTFQSKAGSRLDGMSLGLNFNDVVLLDADFWSQNISGLGTVTSLDYGGSDLAIVYPLRPSPAFTFYLGPGARLGSIMVDDSEIDRGSVSFGNNALMAVAGAKLKVGHVGLDLRYSYDLASSYTGYHTVRLGAFYEFGR